MSILRITLCGFKVLRYLEGLEIEFVAEPLRREDANVETGWI
jgi:hypothetical protein